MHSRSTNPPGSEPLYITGIQFVDEEPTDSGSDLSDLIKRLK
jgi:hypothetical protein